MISIEDVIKTMANPSDLLLVSRGANGDISSRLIEHFYDPCYTLHILDSELGLVWNRKTLINWKLLINALIGVIVRVLVLVT